MAEEAQAELFAVPVGGGLPFVEEGHQALAARLQVRAGSMLRSAFVLEALVAEVAEELEQALRDVVQPMSWNATERGGRG